MSKFDEELERELKKIQNSVYSGTGIDAPTRYNSRTSASPMFDAPIREDANKMQIFKKGAFEDGYQFGDVTKTILGTFQDWHGNVAKGAIGTVEGVLDWGAYGLSDIAEAMGKDKAKENLRKIAEADLMETFQPEAYKKFAKQAEKNSILGETTKQGAQVLGQGGLMMATGGLLGTAGAGTAGTTVATTLLTGTSSMGSARTEAYQGGATDEEARKYSTAAGIIDAATELLSGGMGKAFNAVGFSKGLLDLDDIAAKAAGKLIKSDAGRNVLQYLVKSGFEGGEEVLAGLGQAIAKKLTYMSEKEFADIVKDEKLFEQFLLGTFAGAVFQSGDLASSIANKKDFVTGMTANEQAVVDKEFQKRIEEKKKAGDKIDAKTKNKLYDDVVSDMEKGNISTDTIEQTLAADDYAAFKAEEGKFFESDDYKSYKSENEKSYQQIKEIEAELNELEEEGYSQYAESLKAKLEELKKNTDSYESMSRFKNDVDRLKQMRNQIRAKVYEQTKGDRLSESYNELIRSSQNFSVDLKKYSGKARKVMEQVMASGLVDNRNQTHEFWDTMANISADRDIDISVGTTEQILDALEQDAKDNGMEFDRSAFDGKTIDGVWTKNGIVLNPKTKRALNVVVGHEITHSLEKSKHYGELQKFLFNYGQKEYKKRFDERAGQYKNIYTDEKYKDKIDREVTADMVGDYLFTDFDFVQQLSAKNRNLFQRIWDEVKYLCKVATAGSKEARELEKVKKTFEKVWRDTGKTDTDSGAKLSVSDSDGKALSKEQQDFFKDSKVRDENGNLKVMYHGTSSGDHTVFDPYGKAKYGLFGVGTYFTDSKSIAESYTKKGKGKNPQVYETYLNITNPMDMDAAADPQQWEEAFPDAIFPDSGTNEDFYRAMEEYFEDEQYSKWEAAEAAMEAIEGMGYDGITHIGGGRVNTDGEKHRVYIAFEPEQIKNADNQTPTSDPDIRYSVSEAENQKGLNPVREVEYSISYDTEYSDNAIKLNESQKNVDPAVLKAAKDVRAYVAKRLTEMTENGVALPPDKIGDTWHKDESYGGTMENTLVCPRSLAPEAFMDAVSKNVGRPLTVKEQIYVGQELMSLMTTREDLRNQSFMAQCVYCYVAADRMAQREFLGEYIKQRDAVLAKIEPGVDTSLLEADHNALAAWWENKKGKKPELSDIGKLYQEFLNKRKPTGATYSRFKMWVDNYVDGTPMIDGNHLASIEEIAGDLSNFEPAIAAQIKDAWKYAQSASWAKKRTSYVAYNGQILKWDEDVVNALNEHYGMRMYSFSDYHPAFVLENMQMITDAAVRGLKTLAYTKDLDFAEIFAPTHANINISTFGFEKNGQVYEDNQMGAEWAKAKALREQYPNVGITFVATNDTITEWAMKQDWIDVVIPYHMVKTGKVIADYFGYKNYTKESSDKKTNKWRTDKAWKEDHVGSIAPTMHDNDLNTYLAALEANGLKPRFERFLKNPETRPYYMKLVNECRLPASKSQPVEPKFSQDAIERTLARLATEGYYTPIGGSVDRMMEIAADVAEGIAPLSVSDNGQTFKEYGKWNVYGKDALKTSDRVYEDIAPVAENFNAPKVNVNTEQEEVAPPPTDADAPPLYDSAERKSVPDGQQTFLEDDGAQAKTTRKQLHERIVDNIKAVFWKNGIDFDKVLKKAKNLSTFSTVDNTPQRVMEKSLGYKEGGILADATVNKAAQNETEGIKWLNSFTDRKNGLLAQISKQYNIKPGSKESAAAQMYAEGFYVNEQNEIIRYGDAELAADFPNVTKQNRIKWLARDSRIRQIYDETLNAINESRVRNGYPPIPRLENYFLHFRAMSDTFSKLGLPFNPNDIRAKDLPTDLNGVTADLKPGQPFFASAMHREGKRTSFDLLGGLEQYLTSAKNQIYHIDDIQTLRALRNYIADTYGQAHGLENLDELSQEAQFEHTKQVYNGHLSTFARFLHEEANILAGKTALADRAVEGWIGRKGLTFLDTLNRQVGANMVGYNVSSSLTNLLATVQAFAKSNKAAFLKGFTQFASNKVNSIYGKGDGFAEQSPVMIRRKGAERFHRNFWQKMSDPGYALMGAVDEISTELIARAKYNELVSKGMDSQQAHIETDKWVSRLMGDRSLGQMPQLYNSKVANIFLKFQLEVRNQLDSQFYDTIQEAKVSNEDIQNGLLKNAKTAAKVTSTFFQLAVAQHLFGKAFESVAGYNPAFDIISAIIKTFGWDDDEEDDDTVLDNISQGFLELLGDMPYYSVLSGGRVPISEALPVAELFNGKDQYGNELHENPFVARVITASKAAPYYLLPGGYGQVKKTVAGLKMFSDDHPIAGSYTDSGNLRFPVEDNLANRAQAAIFGQWASGNARDYFDNERSALKPKQIQELVDVGMSIQDYWKYRDGLNDRSTLAEKVDYINGLNLTTAQKNVLVNNLTDRKEAIDMSDYDQYSGLEEFDYAHKNPEKYAFFEKLGIDYETYKNADDDAKDAYDWASENPEKFTFSKAVASDVVEYRKYASDLYDIKADKDENGKTISGSRKNKVFEYIDSLDISAGSKMILFKSEYPSDNNYNRDILEYLKARNDIPMSDRLTILKELGFKVDSNGRVSW